MISPNLIVLLIECTIKQLSGALKTGVFNIKQFNYIYIYIKCILSGSAQHKYAVSYPNWISQPCYSKWGGQIN